MRRWQVRPELAEFQYGILAEMADWSGDIAILHLSAHIFKRTIRCDIIDSRKSRIQTGVELQTKLKRLAELLQARSCSAARHQIQMQVVQLAGQLDAGMLLPASDVQKRVGFSISKWNNSQNQLAAALLTDRQLSCKTVEQRIRNCESYIAAVQLQTSAGQSWNDRERNIHRPNRGPDINDTDSVRSSVDHFGSYRQCRRSR
ncbi:hypothetical protein D3C81_1226200 [compost metagenome]